MKKISLPVIKPTAIKIREPIAKDQKSLSFHILPPKIKTKETLKSFPNIENIKIQREAQISIPASSKRLSSLPIGVFLFTLTMPFFDGVAVNTYCPPPKNFKGFFA